MPPSGASQWCLPVMSPSDVSQWRPASPGRAMMSTESVRRFNQRLIEDEEVRTTLATFALSDVDGVRAYAAQLGYAFSEQDLISVAQELGIRNAELTDDQLEAVAGGQPLGQIPTAYRYDEFGVAIFANVIKR